jgi:AcrR family transcriptional regulator
VPDVAAKPQKSLSHTQRRGDERRQRLLAAATTLLEHQDAGDITFAAVCGAAGVPPGSARFFYRDTHELLRALMMDLAKEHDAALMAPFRPRDLEDWRSLIECLIDRSARFQRSHAVFAKLSIGGQTLPELKRMDREADRQRSLGILALLDEYFVLPRIPDLERITYFIVETVDLAFSLSMNEAGRITPAWLELAKSSATELLAHYFGGELKRRPSGPGI